MITSKEIVRILECHTPLTGLIIEKLNYVKKTDFQIDGMWSSSLTDLLSEENQITNQLIIRQESIH